MTKKKRNKMTKNIPLILVGLIVLTVFVGYYIYQQQRFVPCTPEGEYYDMGVARGEVGSCCEGLVARSINILRGVQCVLPECGYVCLSPIDTQIDIEGIYLDCPDREPLFVQEFYCVNDIVHPTRICELDIFYPLSTVCTCYIPSDKINVTEKGVRGFKCIHIG